MSEGLVVLFYLLEQVKVAKMPPEYAELSATTVVTFSWIKLIDRAHLCGSFSF